MLDTIINVMQIDMMKKSYVVLENISKERLYIININDNEHTIVKPANYMELFDLLDKNENRIEGIELSDYMKKWINELEKEDIESITECYQSEMIDELLNTEYFMR